MRRGVSSEVKAGFAVGQAWAKMLSRHGLPGALGDDGMRGSHTRESTSVGSGTGKTLRNASLEAARKEQRLIRISF